MLGAQHCVLCHQGLATRSTAVKLGRRLTPTLYGKKNPLVHNSSKSNWNSPPMPTCPPIGRLIYVFLGLRFGYICRRCVFFRQFPRDRRIWNVLAIRTVIPYLVLRELSQAGNIEESIERCP